MSGAGVGEGVGVAVEVGVAVGVGIAVDVGGGYDGRGCGVHGSFGVIVGEAAATGVFDSEAAPAQAAMEVVAMTARINQRGMYPPSADD